MNLRPVTPDAPEPYLRGKTTHSDASMVSMQSSFQAQPLQLHGRTTNVLGSIESFPL